MQSAAKSYINQHVDVLISYLGMPTEERVIAGRRIISWYVSNKGVIPMTSPTTATGTLYGAGETINITITGTETTYYSYDYNCKLDALVNEKYKVLSLSWEGDQAGCRTFYSRLSKINKWDTTEHKTEKWAEERDEMVFKRQLGECFKYFPGTHPGTGEMKDFKDGEHKNKFFECYESHAAKQKKEQEKFIRKQQGEHDDKLDLIQVDKKTEDCLEKAEKNTSNPTVSNEYFEMCLIE